MAIAQALVGLDSASCSSCVLGPDSSRRNASQQAETFAAGMGCTAPAEDLSHHALHGETAQCSQARKDTKADNRKHCLPEILLLSE